MNKYLDVIGRRLRSDVAADPTSAAAEEAVLLSIAVLEGLTAQLSSAQAVERYVRASGEKPDIDAGGSGILATRDQVGRRIESLTPGEECDWLKQVARNELLYLTSLRSVQSPEMIAGQSLVTSENLAVYLDRKFPADAPFQGVELIELPGGGSKNTWLVELAATASFGSSIVLRQEADTNFLGNDIFAEFAILKALDDLDLPTAVPIAFEPDSDLLGKPFILSSRLPGRNIGDLWGFAPGVDGRQVAEELAALLARLHGIDHRKLGPFANISGGRDGGDFVAAHIGDFAERWRQGRLGSSPTIALALHWLSSRIEADVPSAIVHGDPALSNILVENGHITGLLDWEFAHLGDPAEDLAYIRSAMETALPWDDFLSCYEQAGGAIPSEVRLHFCEIWRLTRHAITAALAGDAFLKGDSPKLRSAAAGITYLPMLEAQLLSALASDPSP